VWPRGSTVVFVELTVAGEKKDKQIRTQKKEQKRNHETIILTVALDVHEHGKSFNLMHIYRSCRKKINVDATVGP